MARSVLQSPERLSLSGGSMRAAPSSQRSASELIKTRSHKNRMLFALEARIAEGKASPERAPLPYGKMFFLIPAYLLKVEGYLSVSYRAAFSIACRLGRRLIVCHRRPFGNRITLRAKYSTFSVLKQSAALLAFLSLIFYNIPGSLPCFLCPGTACRTATHLEKALDVLPSK